MTHIIATTNMKGGVGKTTLSVNLAACLVSLFQKKVLVVDLDTQINATLSLMSPQTFVTYRKERRTLKYLFEQAIQPGITPTLSTSDVICPYVCTLKGFDVLPGDLDLYDDYVVSSVLHDQALRDGTANFEQAWNHFESKLVAGILKPVMGDYDFIILDCAPGYNLLTRSSLAASHFYLLPAKPEPLSVAGIQLLERRIAKLRASHQGVDQIPTQMLGIVFSMAGGLLSSRYYSKVMQRVRQDFGETQLFKTQIPNDINVSKAVDSFKPVVLSQPSSAGAKAFAKLTQEVLQKLELVLGSKDQKSRMQLSELD
ncbi:ParA family protein [Prochlorothrix hollandica]|uniref:Cobyrinic acid a,c-diamide synthase n=1 Tax=Prochlorothrix hollandica PCC 9006 = CALU 1027 TaxID=317619 RepID=A0A0M2PSK1_PROHO|nr:ParA family protein [Prochlorothrix hollandica]KKI98142.1 cobyrinic acid a,c-diamide synthase [Prochlorothrix hollandica PCC 9006 = CALU 1027]